MEYLQFREPFSAWSHLAGLVVSLPGIFLLMRRCSGDIRKRLSLVVYGVSLSLCYLASTLYHGVRLPPERIAAYARLDGIGILALIAGTYTPMASSLLRGRWRSWTLAAVWGVAVGASILIVAGFRFPLALSTCLYLAMGWGAVVCYAELARVASHSTLLPILVGGLFYSIGAVLNLVKWPVLWPGTFGTHDLFHLFVLAGSLTHFLFILKFVAPYVRAA
jgi:hemolysin III